MHHLIPSFLRMYELLLPQLVIRQIESLVVEYMLHQVQLRLQLVENIHPMIYVH